MHGNLGFDEIRIAGFAYFARTCGFCTPWMTSFFKKHRGEVPILPLPRHSTGEVPVKRYIIDINALISFVTDRNRAQQEVVAPLLAATARMKCSLLCHQFVLSEFVFVMEKVYNTPEETINAMLRDFIAMPGVTVIQNTDFAILLDLWPATITDFGDGLVAATGKMHKGVALLTLAAVAWAEPVFQEYAVCLQPRWAA